jgi:hypothetical protein
LAPDFAAADGTPPAAANLDIASSKSSIGAGRVLLLMQLFEDAYLKVKCRVSALVMKSPMTLEPAALRNSLGELQQSLSLSLGSEAHQ